MFLLTVSNQWKIPMRTVNILIVNFKIYFKFQWKVHLKLATLWQVSLCCFIWGAAMSWALHKPKETSLCPRLPLRQRWRRFLYTSKSFTAIFSRCHTCWPILWLFGNEARVHKQGSREVRDERRQAKEEIALQASSPGNEEVLLISLTVLIL